MILNKLNVFLILLELMEKIVKVNYNLRFAEGVSIGHENAVNFTIIFRYADMRFLSIKPSRQHFISLIVYESFFLKLLNHLHLVSINGDAQEF